MSPRRHHLGAPWGGWKKKEEKKRIWNYHRAGNAFSVSSGRSCEAFRIRIIYPALERRRGRLRRDGKITRPLSYQILIRVLTSILSAPQRFCSFGQNSKRKSNGLAPSSPISKPRPFRQKRNRQDGQTGCILEYF